MDPLKKFAALVLVASLCFLCLLEGANAQSARTSAEASAPKTLYAQSAMRILDREFQDPRISYLLFDARSQVLLSSRWEDAARPIALGSLVKPFTALAYAEAHGFVYPTHVCKGESSGCWQIHPHGELDIVSAIAVSCNSYFRALTANLRGEQLLPTANTFGLDPPNPELTGVSLMGLGELWPITPLRMAHAYLELYRRRDQPGVRELLDGMTQSAQRGTGAGVGRALKHTDALVKTGTAPCTHPRTAPADGFVVALVPANQPEILLMIRVHGVAGAKAAVTAGRMLKRMEE
ncbi:MAG TPA: penicillin-binding transpeptidase domain-containing protein [Candidatus Angelobacter sp.]|nr:penicillin-binding transpeptidase domain-containing protein [Candidatus Angelobacter sp.]